MHRTRLRRRTALVPLLEASEQIRELKLENASVCAKLAGVEEALMSMTTKFEASAADLKSHQKAEKKLRADIARCASATLQLIGQQGNVAKEEKSALDG